MTRLLFAHPEWLWPVGAVLGAAVSILLAGFVVQRRRSRRLLGHPRLATARSSLGDAALAAALTAIAVGLLGPRIAERRVLVSTSGLDVVIALDVSRSMDATDVPPSRMERSRAVALGLLERLAPGDRAALAAFAGRGVLLTPLTPDMAALAEMIPALDSNLIRPGGSLLDAGVEASLGAFEAESERPRVLVLTSDGEASHRNADPSWISARRENVRVLSVAFGSDLGSDVPDHGVPLRDAFGEIVVSRRQLEPMARLAEETGGRLFAADEWGRIDLDEAAREIARRARAGPGEMVERTRVEAVVLPFAALAFALLLLEAAPRPWWSGLRRSLGIRASGTAWLMAFSILAAGAGRAQAPETAETVHEQTMRALETRARTRPLSAKELLRLGLSRAELGRWDDAERSFRASALSAPDSRIAALAYYDLGVAALRRGALDHARDAFFDALAVQPGDPRTRFNLEWTLRRLDQEPPEKPPAADPPPSPEENRPPPEPDPASPEENPADDPNREAQGKSPGQVAKPAEPAMDEATRERWLERIEDDPSTALRNVVNSSRSGRERPRPGGPTW